MKRSSWSWLLSAAILISGSACYQGDTATTPTEVPTPVIVAVAEPTVQVVVETPTPEPTAEPTVEPTPVPTKVPTRVPTAEPTVRAAAILDLTTAVTEAAKAFEPGVRAWAIMVAKCESGFRPWEVGRAGEIGLWQIHPIHFTSQWLLNITGPNVIAALMDPIINGRVAAHLLSIQPSAWRSTQNGC